MIEHTNTEMIEHINTRSDSKVSTYWFCPFSLHRICIVLLYFSL